VNIITKVLLNEKLNYNDYTLLPHRHFGVKIFTSLSISALGLLALACGGGGGGGSPSAPYVPATTSPTFVESTQELQKVLTTLPATTTKWNETSIRKILHCFALGSAVRDEQIKTWAGMSAQAAIQEILSLNAINPKMVPSSTTMTLSNGELSELAQIWASAEGKPNDSKYSLDAGNGPAEVWIRAMLSSQLNPVRQRIGLMETNDHMAINLDSAVESRQAFRYYDDILNTLAAGSDYYKVVATAAVSAAVATQYNHRQNKFVDGEFLGNEDFAREFHQLYFGILGTSDPEHHEFTNIRNTAKALTDIRIDKLTVSKGTVLSDMPVYGQEKHYPSALDILNSSIAGGNAYDKIWNLSQKAVADGESLDHLPLLLVQKIADPEMSSTNAANVVAAWKELPEKSFLALLRSYAISDVFLDSARFKAWNVLERQTIIANRFLISEADRDRQNLVNNWALRNLDNGPFRPIHDVFGSQKGRESLESSHVFSVAWSQSVSSVYAFSNSQDTGTNWKKDWSTEAPKDSEGQYRVSSVARWLWERFIADGGANYGLLEQAQVLALLASGRDYGLHFNAEDPLAVYSEADLQTAVHTDKLSDLGISLLRLNDSDPVQKRIANERVGLAIAFIIMTPYMFGQEG
jgi:hypothetical protein